MGQHVQHAKLVMRVLVAHGHIMVEFRDDHIVHQEHTIHQQDKHLVLHVVLAISVPAEPIGRRAQQQ